MQPIFANAARRSLLARPLHPPTTIPSFRHAVSAPSSSYPIRGFASKRSKNGKSGRDINEPSSPKNERASSQSPNSNIGTAAPTPESTSDIPPASQDASHTPSTPLPASLSLDFSPPEAQIEAPIMEGERTGARSSKGSLSELEQRKRWFARISMALFVAGAGVYGWYLGREWESEELKALKLTPEIAPSTRWGRTRSRFMSMFDYFSEPAWPELLPPPLPAPHQKPYTLVVSMDDLLVTSTWDRVHGWRTAKRPGVDYFLAYLSQFYEVVIFTTQYHYTALPVLEKLDPYNFFITYRLFRDATRATDDGPVKDLSYLNRDLSKVIILDTHANHVKTHPENAIVLKSWKGEATGPEAKGLVEMIPFLESIGIYRPQDVRPILERYQGKDIPQEYAKKEAEAKAMFIEDWKAKGGHKGLSSGGFTLSSLFGASPSSQLAIPETYLETKRREAQQLYLQEQQYIKDHKEEFEALLEQDRQQQAREASGNLFAALGNMTGLQPPGPPPGQEGVPGAISPAGAVTGATESAGPASAQP